MVAIVRERDLPRRAHREVRHGALRIGRAEALGRAPARALVVLVVEGGARDEIRLPCGGDVNGARVGGRGSARVRRAEANRYEFDRFAFAFTGWLSGVTATAGTAGVQVQVTAPVPSFSAFSKMYARKLLLPETTGTLPVDVA